MADIQVTADAAADLDDILRYSLDSFGDVAAQHYFDLIEAATVRLRLFPASGAVYPGLTAAMRYVPVGRHRIFYTYEDDTVVIWRVLHERMQAMGRVQLR